MNYLSNDKLTQFLIKYDIDIYQFWILYLRATNDYSNLEAYCEKFGLFDRELHKIVELEEKGYIAPLDDLIKNGKIRFNFLDLIPIGDFARITDWIFVDCDIAGIELYEAYPKMLNINGRMVPSGKGEVIGGILYDKDKLLTIYSKKINNNKDLHKRIIEAIKAAREMDTYTFTTLRSFIFDELWEALFEVVDSTPKSYSKTRSI